MRANPWMCLLAAGCLGLCAAARGQVAPDAPDQPGDVVPVQPAPPQLRFVPTPADPGFAPPDLGGPRLLPLYPDRRPESSQYYRVWPVLRMRTSLGMMVSPVSPALAHQLRLGDGAGLVVDRVFDGSPASRAGIRQYDVLESFDGRLVGSPWELALLVRAARAKTTEVAVGLIREGKRLRVMVEFAPPQAPPPTGRPPGVQPPSPAPQAPDAPPAPRGRGSSLSLYYQDGRLFATVYDANGRILVSGPVDVLRQLKNLPPDARKALEQLRDDPSGDDSGKPTDPTEPQERGGGTARFR